MRRGAHLSIIRENASELTFPPFLVPYISSVILFPVLSKPKNLFLFPYICPYSYSLCWWILMEVTVSPPNAHSSPPLTPHHHIHTHPNECISISATTDNQNFCALKMLSLTHPDVCAHSCSHIITRKFAH